MDDVWGSAWSTTGLTDGIEVENSILNASKWNSIQRDADDETVDVGIPSWNGHSAGWGGTESELWHNETSTSRVWGPNISPHAAGAEDEEREDSPAHEGVDGKDIPKTILPTPPESPLALPSPPLLPSSLAEEILTCNLGHAPSLPGSPDPFGSFESAETADAELPKTIPWTRNPPDFSDEVVNAPWSGAWDRDDKNDEHEPDDERVKDEWEIAQETRRRQERKVPPQLLDSLIAQWNEYAKDILSVSKLDDRSQDWRRGLGHIEGLSDLVESLIPAAPIPPPSQFSKTAVSRALQESLKLTRSFSLIQSSPMAHLYASKGSIDWELSVKAQKTAANDEWGWDLKQEAEDKADSKDPFKEKKTLLSFWSRKPPVTSSVSSGHSIVPSVPKPATPAPPSPTGPNADIHPKATSSSAASPVTATMPTPATVGALSVPTDSSAAQPSVVSRFFNRFSRKPPPQATSSGNDNCSSLPLSDDDISALSDIVPSTSEASVDSGSGSFSLLRGGHNSSGSLEPILQSQRKHAGFSTKHPAPLIPPPASSSYGAPKSAESDSSFDAKMADAKLFDLIENMGQPGLHSGYAPVSFEPIDMPEESNPKPTLQSPAILLPVSPPAPLPPLQPSPWLTRPNPTLNTPLPPLLPPPIAPSLPGTRVLTSTPPLPPRSPPSPLFDKQRRDNPLPPTPQHTSNVSPLIDVSSSSTIPDFATRALSSTSSCPDTSADFTDFGDFVSPSISPPMRSPLPPRVPRKTSRAADHRRTKQLLETATSMSRPWPAPQQALPKPLAPPPGTRSSGAPETQHHDLLSNNLPLNPRPAYGVQSSSPAPIFTDLLSHPTSASIFGGPQLNAASSSGPPSTISSLFDATPQPKSSGTAGLSAQELSFFEGF